MTHKPPRVSPVANQTKANGERRLETSCPICGAFVSYSERSASFPFCSERCRLLDLGRWMRERYAVPCSQAAAGELGPDGDG